MREIYVAPGVFDDAADECQEMIRRIREIERQFRYLATSLEWELKSKANINRFIYTLCDQLDNAEQTMTKHYRFLRQAKSAYLEAEGTQRSETGDIRNDLYKDSGTYTEPSANITSSDEDDFESWLDKQLEMFLYEFIAKITSEYGKYDISKLGVVGSLLDIAVSMYKHFDKYSGGIESTAAFVLSSISTGVDAMKNWTKTVIKLDDYLKAKKGLEPLKGLQKYNVGWSLASTAVDIAEKMHEHYEKYANGVESTAAFLWDSFETGVTSFNKLAESVLELDNFLKASKGLEPLKTGFKTFCDYIPVINVPIRAVDRAVESYGEYSADGEFDYDDGLNLVVDSTVEALFAVGSGLISIHLGPVGTVASALFDGAVDKYELSEKAADGIRQLADEAVYKLEHPEEANVVETVAYSTLYGIGYVADGVYDLGCDVVQGVGDAISSIGSLFK